MTLTLTLMRGTFAVCRLNPSAVFPEWAAGGNFFSITRTPDELSIVCPAHQVPEGIRAERDWRCLQVQGPLDFALTGILASLAAPLAQAGISIFALSTYDTDYLLLKEHALAKAIVTLRRAGHTVREHDD